MPWTLANVVRTHARARGRRPMITYGQRTITYAGMDERSSRVARALAAEGVAAQDRVAFLDKNGPEYFEILFGGGKINAVNVAVNWRLAPAEMKYTIDDAEAKVLFVGPDFFPHLAELEGKLRTVKKIVALGEHPRHEGYAGWVGRQLPEDTGLTSAPGDVAMQLYTSGTTGLPKGAMLTNANLGTILPHVSAPWSLEETSVNVVAMPPFHIGGSGWALCGMWNGCHSILFREFVPQEILAALVRHRVTNALFVPAMLWTRSVQNMKGYWNKPEETARAFTPDGWLKTGDAGFADAEGYLFLTDRVKDMIVSGAENVYPAEVENALSGHPDIADVAVIGVPHDKWGETVKAIVVRRPGADPTAEALIDYARQRLARYKCPTSVDFLDALPRNPSGKLLKRQLREPYWEGHERRIHSPARSPGGVCE